MYKIERISNKHMSDWISMMLQLWDDNSYEVLRTEHVNIMNDDKFGNFICYKGNEAVGFINMSLRTEYVEGAEIYPVAYVEGIFVKGEYRRKGVAKRLLDKGAEWGMEKGCKQMASDSELSNVLSQDFHAGVGFEEVARVVCYIKDL